MLLAIDQRIDVVGSEFESVAMRDRIGRASLDAIPAENAARIIDIVDFRVALAGRNSVCVRVLCSLEVNAIRREIGRASCRERV